jgi:Tfp pilus assembly protein PilX
MTHHARPVHTRPGREDGIALIVALLAIVLMTALGMALMLNSQTETMISANYRDATEAEYAADAGIERVMDDVLTVPDWNTLLTSPDGVKAGVTSAFIGASSVNSITLADGRTLDLTAATNMINCAKTTTCSDSDMNTSTVDRPWGVNNPRFRLYAWGPMNDIIPTGTVNSPYYVAVWVADDAAENDNNPNRDGDPPANGAAENTGAGVLTLRAEAFGAGGVHHVIEATIAKTDSTEIERGYTGQRGQDEQNRRARKAAVQTPGKGLTRSEMTLSGGMTKQAF